MPIKTFSSLLAHIAVPLSMAIAAFFGTLPANSAVVVWQGDVVIDSASGNCTADVALVPATGRVLRTVLRPKNIDENGVNTTVMFLANQMTMFAMVLDKGAMPSGTAVVFGNDSSGVIKANVGVRYANFVQNPASITVSTENVTLQGTIRDFLYVPGCDVTFRAAYSKRPD